MRFGLLGKGSGLKVSRLALGCGLFGTRWGYGAAPDDAARMLDAYLDAGGNFLDTADSYQFGESEELLARLLERRRDAVVLATKYTNGAEQTPGLTASGNGRHVMVRSVEASLKRLRTDRIDLMWVHMADGLTSTDEIMRGLDDLVSAGKVVHIGFSDFPAWRIARAATLAELRGWAPLVAIQTEYSLVERTSDRELLPMAEAFGLGVAAWSPLGGGMLTGKHRRGETGRAETFGRLVHLEDDARKRAIVDAVISVAEGRGVSPAQVAVAWIAGNGLFPILGPRTPAQLADTLGAADLALSADEQLRLDEVSSVSLGFPHDLLADEAQQARFLGGLADRFDGLGGLVA